MTEPTAIHGHTRVDEDTLLLTFRLLANIPEADWDDDRQAKALQFIRNIYGLGWRRRKTDNEAGKRKSKR